MDHNYLRGREDGDLQLHGLRRGRYLHLLLAMLLENPHFRLWVAREVQSMARRGLAGERSLTECLGFQNDCQYHPSDIGYRSSDSFSGERSKNHAMALECERVTANLIASLRKPPKNMVDTLH